MMAQGQFLRNLFRRIDRRIHRAEKRFVRILERRSNVCKPNVADNHEVDIACRVLVMAGERAIDKCNFDTVLQRLQSLRENVSKPDGPEDEPLKVAENRALRLGRVIRSVSVVTSAKNSR